MKEGSCQCCTSSSELSGELGRRQQPLDLDPSQYVTSAHAIAIISEPDRNEEGQLPAS